MRCYIYCAQMQTEGDPEDLCSQNLKENSGQNIMRTEIGVLHVSHPNIIKLKEIFETPTEISLVLELVTGELFDRLWKKRYYSEPDAADAIKQNL